MAISNEQAVRSALQPVAQAGLIDEPHFILAMRDTGYRSTEAAVAELVDNALEAGARTIDLDVRRDDAGELRVHVLDDGRGMDVFRLANALRFGGTDRFASRRGFGRFGMGLPNSSISQARRVDVYSWQLGQSAHCACLDVDRIAGDAQGLERPRPAALPDWLGPVSQSGTLVVWSRCDRIPHRRPGTILGRFRAAFARWYRYPIWDGVVIRVGGEPLAAIDPLQVHSGSSYPRARAYGRALDYPVRIPGTSLTSHVRVHFYELPVEAWAGRSVEEKRAAGIIGGPTVSVVRAGREIDAGWHFMGAKRRENYDDWWRCEIAFEPDLDELFGVTHSKQGVSPTPLLKAILSPDLEPIARALNARVRKRFAAVKQPVPSPAVRRAAQRDRLLPPPPRPYAQPEGLGYRIEAAPLGTDEFFRPAAASETLVVTINTDHPFYERVYAPACTATDAATRFGIETLLLSASRAMLAERDLPAARLRSGWGDALAAFLS
jgi:hypothetical protein